MSDSIFTGEFFVPGQTKKRLEEDHLARYAFAARFVKGKRVLDIACGSGYGTRSLLDAGARTIDGVDLSQEAVNFACEHYKCNGVDYHCDSIYTYETDEPYDVVISYETIEHVDDHQRALKNLHRLLSEQGVLLISTPNRLITSPKANSITDAPANSYHVLEFVLDEFIDAIGSAGFHVSMDDVYGQRLQPYIKNKVLRKLYRKTFRPHLFKDPAVLPVGKKSPRYYVVVARKS